MKLQAARVAGLIVLTSLLAGPAWAQNNCNQGTSLSGLQTLLTGKTVCAALGNDRWQEYHQPGGALIDWKKGANDPVDPTKQVGTWTVTSVPVGNSGNTRDTVTYNYGAGNSYTYYVCQNASSYTFSATTGATTVTGAALLAGQVACPGASTPTQSPKKAK